MIRFVKKKKPRKLIPPGRHESFERVALYAHVVFHLAESQTKYLRVWDGLIALIYR